MKTSGLLSNRKSVLAIGIVGVVLLGVIGYFLILSPKFSATAGKRADLQKQSLLYQTAKLGLQKQCSTLSDVAKSIQLAGQNALQFPPTADFPGLYKQILAQATKAGISSKTLSVSPTSPIVADGQTVGSLSVTIAATGQPAQVPKFLNYLETMPRAFVVTNVSVGAGDSNVAITISGNAYTIQSKELQDLIEVVLNDKSNAVETCAKHGYPVDVSGLGGNSATPTPSATPSATPSPTAAATATSTPSTGATPTPTTGSTGPTPSTGATPSVSPTASASAPSF